MLSDETFKKPIADDTSLLLVNVFCVINCFIKEIVVLKLLSIISLFEDKKGVSIILELKVHSISSSLAVLILFLAVINKLLSVLTFIPKSIGVRPEFLY